jgi:C_GCAxxG_C_C family probable redox protein
MADFATLRAKVEDLAARKWDTEAIAARVNKMIRDGIPKKKLDPQYMRANKAQILDRVQLRAEEYNFYLKNCAQGTALALMEEFGQGNMEIIKALTPFPGIGSTGEICGGITGSLVNFGLFFATDNPPDLEKMSKTISIAQKFMAYFEGEVGYLYCSDIIEKVIVGRKLNPGESDEAMVSFTKEKGFEKCGLPPGAGVRLAAGFMIDSLKG